MHPDHDDDTTRIAAGWRQGKPLEDPEKTKRWGFIAAKPSEYLIHMRRGRIRRVTTGQGASCFKWPWDSVAIIPTTINRLQFAADQVTREKVGMRVIGLAVYRIVEPELTFRMLNFSYSERAQQKLEEILCEMFVGATRRHVANLTVDEVMTRRKDAIASELMAELAPVVEGHGRADDTTTTGWGVILDTVEVQDVRVLSEQVFRNMQARFRAELARQAREAELAAQRDIAAREADSRRAIEEARIAADAELAAERARHDEAARLAALQRAHNLALAEREILEAKHETALREAALEAERAAAAARDQAALDEQRSQAQAALRRREIELERLAGDLDIALARARKQIENTVSADRIQQSLVEYALPRIAQAFAGAFGDVKLTQIGGSADPSALVAGAIERILAIARAASETRDRRPGEPAASADSIESSVAAPAPPADA